MGVTAIFGFNQQYVEEPGRPVGTTGLLGPTFDDPDDLR
jgi:hypothetical protein